MINTTPRKPLFIRLSGAFFLFVTTFWLWIGKCEICSRKNYDRIQRSMCLCLLCSMWKILSEFWHTATNVLTVKQRYDMIDLDWISYHKCFWCNLWSGCCLRKFKSGLQKAYLLGWNDTRHIMLEKLRDYLLWKMNW